MNTFLEYVARDILSRYGANLSRVAVVFPNKRASLFFNEYLARSVDKPLWSPVYMTISELFQSHSDLKLCDPIKAVADLHKCFVSCTGSSETLDHFYGWGELLLADFDDIDKNMAEADKVFINVHNLYELDDISYLDDEQVAAIRKFFSNFSKENSTELKKRFLNLWSHMYDIYKCFREHLEQQGLAYEGALYRKVADDGSIEFELDRYIFVGFNLLNKVEQKLFDRLRKEGKAAFYWDFDHYYMPKATHPAMHNEAGRYISSYLSDFPNGLDNSDRDIYGNFAAAKDITYISAQTENIQARYISQWLRENGRIADGRRTAIVLCNEELLQTVIHCLPDEADKVNITTGYPLAQSPVASLLRQLVTLKTGGYVAHADKYRLYNVNAVLKHPYMKYISENHKALWDKLNVESKVYYPGCDILCTDEGTRLLFANMLEYEGASLAGKLTHWLVQMTELIARNARDNTDPFFQEALFRTYTLLNRLDALTGSGDLDIDVVTLQRLINQLVRATSIPFHGEPVTGIQIMGVLETRNLDFDHLLILSANEGNMPKGVNDTSFIPYNIRKAHGLTTIDNKVAIYSYYFYRLLQRAHDVTIVYNNSTENGSTGEMSRFMLQIMVESGHRISRKSLQAGQTQAVGQQREVVKTEKVMQKLLGRFDKARQAHLTDEEKDRPLLTPTAINRYIRCPKQFYYNYVCNIKEPDDNDENLIDNRIFGNIFHAASEKIYKKLLQKSHHITADDIKRVLDSKVDVEMAVDEAFKEELFNLKAGSGFHPDYNGLQIINREVIITYMRKLLMTDMRLTPFDIIGLEIDVMSDMEVVAGGKKFTTTVGGRIDRLDCVNDAGSGKRIRVVDYKTGSRRLKTFAAIGDVFNPSNIHDHSDYYLQTILYSGIVRTSKKDNPKGLPVSPALLFIQHSSAEDYDPTLSLGKQLITDVDALQPEFDTLLQEKVNEIFCRDLPFAPTSDDKTCQTCPYSHLCGM